MKDRRARRGRAETAATDPRISFVVAFHDSCITAWGLRVRTAAPAGSSDAAPSSVWWMRAGEAGLRTTQIPMSENGHQIEMCAA
jgi:hypothetical protein